MCFFFFFFREIRVALKEPLNEENNLLKKLCQMEQTKIMLRMRKGNSSSEFALNMPAGERQKRGAAYCMGVGRLFPAAARPLVLAPCPELLTGDNREEGEQKGEEKSVPQAHHPSPVVFV